MDEKILDKQEALPLPQMEPPVKYLNLEEATRELEKLQSKDSLAGATEFYQAVAWMPDLHFETMCSRILIQADRFKCKTMVNNTLQRLRRSVIKEQRQRALEKQKAREEAQKKAKEALLSEEFMIAFDPENPDIPILQGGNKWGGDSDGMFTIYDGEKTYFCRHPIQPIKIHYNMETGKYETTLAFRKKDRENGDIEQWQTITVPKINLSKASTVVDLAAFGIHVSSETAKLMTKYLSDIEILNEQVIPFERTTSKLGWRDEGKYFLPYDKEILFDAKDSFRGLYEALTPSGSYDDWLSLARELRAGESDIPRIALAASFASVLVPKLNLLPFIVDFWGNTENGKTVLLMLACSVWANPAENAYISSFKSTDTAFEAYCDVLNSLPMILDDSSHAQTGFNFENFVYGICSGKGKSRSNKQLGKNRERSWKNNTLTNGERPLASMVSQGGAINRILEVHCNQTIFKDPRNVFLTCMSSYGWAGKIFVEKLKQMSTDDAAMERLIDRYEVYSDQLKDNAMDKQKQAVACILLADYLATEWIFQDGRRLTPGVVDKLLADPDEVNEGARAYDYLMDVINSRRNAFDIDCNCPQLGTLNLSKGEACFYKHPLADCLKQGGFSLEAFLSWANGKKLLRTDGINRLNKVMSMPFKSEDGLVYKKNVRVIVLKIEDEQEGSVKL